MNMWGPVLSALMPGWTLAGRGRTWPNPRPHSHIDHIAVNAPVRVESFEVVRAGASDHFPVRAVIRF
jgi:endonuclease/exonuclease/phosphatase family metal-dependent hydrolase